MNKQIATIVAALIVSPAFATSTPYGDCVGQNACMTTNNHPVANGGNATGGNATGGNATGGNQHQWQESSSNASAAGGYANGGAGGYANGGAGYGGYVQSSVAPNFATSNSSSTNVRYIQQVQPVQPVIVTPAADVSRFASECGPRMQVMRRDVQGRYYGALTTDTFIAGEDMSLVPADEPYRRFEIAPGIVQLIGHRVVETSAVTNVSGGRSIGIGVATSNHSGSGSSGGAGAMQRLVTTIRLNECVAATIDRRPLIAPKPVVRPRIKKHIAKPVCEPKKQ